MHVRTLFFVRCFLLGCLMLIPRVSADSAFEESFEDSRRFRWFGGPTREGPEAQWEKVLDFQERGRLRPAIRHAGYLVATWPDHALAPQAQRLIGDLRAQRGNYAEAFQAYQVLMDAYAGQFDYAELLKLQIDMAERLETNVVRALFTRYTQPLEAVPLYRQIITNAPHAEIAPELLFRIGEILMGERMLAEAITEFDLLEQRYPRHPLARQAAYRRAEAFALLARRHPTDASATQSAWMAYRYFLEMYPTAEERVSALEEERYFYNRLAGMRYQQALFYLENLQRPAAALVAFRALVQQFPESEWTDPALQHIETLQEPPESL